MPPTLYLIDGHALAYRTYFALTAANPSGDRWRTASGEPTAGIYGFASVLMRLLEQDKPEYLAVAFDTGKTFRHEMFPEYKGTRAKMPDDLRVQVERIRQLVDAFNIPRLEVEGYEADDVLGTIARQATSQGLGVRIITGDRDLLQLVDERTIVNLAGSKLSEAKDYLAEDVFSYLGVRPDQVVDYKALVGDKSDNIPGVPGIGDKTACTLLAQYGTLEIIYAHLADLAKGVRSKLEAGKDSALLSQDLARIRVDVPIRLDIQSARSVDFDEQVVENLFRELEFRSLVGRLRDLGKKASPPPTQSRASVQPAVSQGGPKGSGKQLSLFNDEVRVSQVPIEVHSSIQVHVVDNQAALDELTARLASAAVISFDTETTSTNPVQADIVGISVSIQAGEGYYIPVGHRDGTGTQLPIRQVIDALRGPMTDARIPKIGHNIKYDFIVLARCGLRVAPLTFDTMIAEWLINPDSRNLGLKNLAWIRLSKEMIHIEDLIGKGKNQITMAEVPIQSAAPYAADDAVAAIELMPVLQKDLDAQNAAALLAEMEMPLVSVLADMEMTGIAVDAKHFTDMALELQQRMEQIERQIYADAGIAFNLNSTQQLSKVLFERLRLEPPDRRKRTSSGHFSTSADVLDELRGQHPVVDAILEYRELSKLKSTYLDALPLQINPATGRIHTSYNQCGAATGRLASSDPNLQNIPTRTDLGHRVREGFIAAPGKVLLSIDYSQIELRLVAVMSGDEAMLAAFRAGQDIHAATAAAIFNTPLENVTREQRRNAKAINFGLIYGMSAFGLSRSTGLTLAEAENFSQAYFMQFPKVKGYLAGLRRMAAEQGYVETMFGRRRYFPGLREQTNANVRNREEREAINSPIQGTAADILKVAMCQLPEEIRKAGLSAKMLLQVHDELVLECDQGDLEKTAQIVQQVMEHAKNLPIPLSTEAKCGNNWGNLQPLHINPA